MKKACALIGVLLIAIIIISIPVLFGVSLVLWEPFCSIMLGIVVCAGELPTLIILAWFGHEGIWDEED